MQTNYYNISYSYLYSVPTLVSLEIEQGGLEQATRCMFRLKIAPQPTLRSTPDLWKLRRAHTVSPRENSTK